jgi:bacillithiol biosynthesis deacetylase BshB1
MNILAIGIHPDDIELGCGGTVIVAADGGHDVVMVDLSDGAASTNGTLDEREREAARAAEIMGVTGRQNLSLPDTAIQSEDPAQVRRLVSAIRTARPEVVLAPSSDDPHPDHASGGTLVRRAVYLAGIRGYQPDEERWSVQTVMIYGGRVEVEPHLIVDITSTQKTKMLAIAAHESQFSPGAGKQPTPLNAPEFLPAIEARDRVCGQKIRVEFGEAFRLLKPIALRDFSIFST